MCNVCGNVFTLLWHFDWDAVVFVCLVSTVAANRYMYTHMYVVHWHSYSCCHSGLVLNF